MAAPEETTSSDTANLSPPETTSISRRRMRMSSKCDRVLIYTTCYNVLDGVTLTIRKIEQEILASGGHVCVLTTNSGDPKHTDLIGPPSSHPNRTVLFLDNSVPIPFVYDPENPAAQYHLGFSLSETDQSRLDDFRPSVVHITVPDCTGLHVVDYARKRELPLMGTYHSNIVDYLDHYPGVSWVKPIIAAFFRHQYNFLHTLYVPTPYIRQHLIETDKMDRVTNLKIWGRGVDVDRFSPTHRSMTFRRNLGISDTDVVICFVGRLVPEKRCDIFINVVKRLSAERIKFKALVVGAGPYQDEMKALPNTTCTGWLSGDDLAVAYASSDVFLFPSSVETFGNVTLEAAASGLPLVVCGGCSGHLVKGEDGDENGFPCLAGDVNSFHSATRRLITDSETRERMASKSRPHALTFEKSSVSQQMLCNYEAVVEQFDVEFGGKHRNRDGMYVNADSFQSGMLPRPYGMGLVEAFFVFSFRVMHWILMTYLFVQESFLVPALIALRLQDPAVSSLQEEDEDGMESKEEVVIEDLNVEVMSMGGGGCSGGDLQAPNKSLVSSESMPPTGGSTSTTSSSSCSQTSSDAVSDGIFDFESDVSDSFSFANSLANIGDGPFCRMLAICFVKVVYFGWRTSAAISLRFAPEKEVERRWEHGSPDTKLKMR